MTDYSKTPDHSELEIAQEPVVQRVSCLKCTLPIEPAEPSYSVLVQRYGLPIENGMVMAVRHHYHARCAPGWVVTGFVKYDQAGVSRKEPEA